MGREQFIEVFMEHLEGKKDIREIPRSQMYLARPTLAALFGTSLKMKKERDAKIIEGVRRYGYSLSPTSIASLELAKTSLAVCVNPRLQNDIS